jgi:hypothetical protein
LCILRLSFRFINSCFYIVILLPRFFLQLVQDRFMMFLCLIRHQVMKTQAPHVLNLELDRVEWVALPSQQFDTASKCPFQ